MSTESKTAGRNVDESAKARLNVSTPDTQARTSRKSASGQQSKSQSQPLDSSPVLDATSISGSGTKRKRMRQKLVGIASRSFPDQPTEAFLNSSDETLHSELVRGITEFGGSSNRSANDSISSQPKLLVPESATKPGSSIIVSEKHAEDRMQVPAPDLVPVPFRIMSEPPWPLNSDDPLLEKVKGVGIHSDEHRSSRKGSIVSSMSGSGSNSQTREICLICKKSSALDRKTLVGCSSCHRKYHRGCHAPTVPANIATWSCVRCQRKSKNFTSIEPTQSSSPGPIVKHSSISRSGRSIKQHTSSQSSTPNTQERLFKRPRSSLYNSEQIENSGEAAELLATPHNISESQVQREIPETPDEQEASIICGDFQGHSQTQVQLGGPVPMSSGDQINDVTDGSMPQLQVQVKVKVNQLDQLDTIRADDQSAQVRSEAALGEIQMQPSPQFSYSNITSVFSTGPGIMDVDNNGASDMEADESALGVLSVTQDSVVQEAVVQEHVAQECVAIQVGGSRPSVHQATQNRHAINEPVNRRLVGVNTDAEIPLQSADVALPQMQGPVERAAGTITRQLTESIPDTTLSWLTTDGMLPVETRERLSLGAQVIDDRLRQDRRSRDRNAIAQTESAQRQNASTQIVFEEAHNNMVDTAVQTDHLQAASPIVPDAVRNDMIDKEVQTDRAEAQEKHVFTKDDLSQRISHGIHELIRPSFTYNDPPPDNFYMKQRTKGPTLEEIKRRPTRKQMMKKGQSCSRLGDHVFDQRWQNMMSGLKKDENQKPEHTIKTTRDVPAHMIHDLGGEVDHADCLDDLLELPTGCFPMLLPRGNPHIQDNIELVFGENTNKSTKSRITRAKTKYHRIGAAAKPPS